MTFAIEPDGRIRQLPPPLRDHGLTERMQGFCQSGCTTPPTVLVEGETICATCARRMGAIR